MADTNSHHAGAPTTEGDGISYRGIIVFMVILFVTVVACEGIVVGMFKFFDAEHAANTPKRAVMAEPAGTLPPPPNLLTDEPANLRHFREGEEHAMDTYSWADKNAGIVQLPIERAKALLLERGLPTVGDPQVSSQTSQVTRPASPVTRPEVKK